VGHGKVTTVTSFRVFAMTCKGVVYGNCGYLDKLSQSVKAMTECRNLRLETISRVAGNWDPRGDSSVAPRDQVARPISRFAYKSPRIADEASELRSPSYRFEARSERIRFPGALEAAAERRINRSAHSLVPPQVVLHVDFLYDFLERSMSMWMLSRPAEHDALCFLLCNAMPTWHLRLNA